MGFVSFGWKRQMGSDTLRSSDAVFQMLPSSIAERIYDVTSTFTRATTATVEDHEGVIREVLSGEVRFQGQRRVENLITASEDFTDAAWINGTGTTKTADTITFDGTATQHVRQIIAYKADRDIVVSVEMKAASALTVGVAVNNSAVWDSYDTDMAVTLTTEWVRYSFGASNIISSTNIRLIVGDMDKSGNSIGGITGTISIRNMQIQDKTGASDPTVPDSYVSTGVLSSPYQGANVDGVKYFLTTNGSSVVSNVVTEVSGTPLRETANWLVGFGTGDSFANESYEWPSKINESAPYGGNFTSVGRGGQDLTGAIGSNFATDIAAIAGGFVILQGGVNDTDTATAADMLAAVVVMEAEATSQGKNFALINISPFGTFSGWNSSRQAVAVSYNSLSAAWALTNNIPYADIYTALGDGGTPENLAAAYDGGDGIHPNPTGHQLIADTIIAAINPLRSETISIGYSGEVASTNSLIYSRDFTNVAWVKTNVTAALDAIGIDGLANGASSLTASAGNGTVFQTVTLTSAARTSSFYVRRKTGTGVIEYTDDGGATYTVITSTINSNTYTRFDITTTQANPSIGFRITTSTDAIEVDMCQIETLAFVTSPIPTTTVAVARNIDILNYPSTYIPNSNFKISFDAAHTSDAQTAKEVYVGCGADAANFMSVFRISGTLVFRLRIGGTIYDASVANTYKAGMTDLIEAEITDSAGMILRFNGVDIATNANILPFTKGANIYIGSDWDGSTPVNAGIDNFTIYEGSF